MIYYDMEGQPIDRIAWADLFDKDRVIEQTTIDDALISTVWLGIDYGFGSERSPLIFETMIFGGDHDGEQWRYATKEQALAGHARAVQLVVGDSPE